MSVQKNHKKNCRLLLYICLAITKYNSERERKKNNTNWHDNIVSCQFRAIQRGEEAFSLTWTSFWSCLNYYNFHGATLWGATLAETSAAWHAASLAQCHHLFQGNGIPRGTLLTVFEEEYGEGGGKFSALFFSCFLVWWKDYCSLQGGLAHRRTTSPALVPPTSRR